MGIRILPVQDRYKLVFIEEKPFIRMIDERFFLMEEIKNEYEKPFAEVCGRRIREIREQEGLSQEKLARLLHCSPVSLGRVERGQQTMKLWRLNIFCELFHVSLDYLFRGVDSSDLSGVPPYLVNLFRNADEVERTILSEQMLSAGHVIEYLRSEGGRRQEDRP